MHNIMLRKDILVQVAATTFLIVGMGIAVHFGAFIRSGLMTCPDI